MIRELIQYKEFLKTSVKKDIRGKYKGSFLGVLWSFINPLLSALIYAIVFPFILKNSQPHYVTFIVIGILPWTFYTTVISQGTFSIIGNSSIIKKVYFPRQILPISAATSGLVNFLISLPIALIFAIISGIGVSWHLIFLPIIILVQYILTLGIIFITSAINVYVRDFEYVVTFITNLLFYITPILYTSDILPKDVGWILNINPMTSIVQGYRDILYYQRIPDFQSIFIVLGVGVVILFIGIKIFSKLQRRFAEEI